MKCNEVLDLLIDYLDGKLPYEKLQEVKAHLDNCESCKKELDEFRGTIDYLEDSFKIVQQSRDFTIESTKQDEVRKYNKKTIKKRSFKTMLIAAIVLTFLSITVFAKEEIFDFIKYWKQRTYTESLSINDLMKKGYGEVLNISKEDNGVRITIKSVIADDINTIVYYKVETLNNQGQYKLDGFKGITYKGDFQSPIKNPPKGYMKDHYNPYSGGFPFYSDVENEMEGVIYLDSLVNEDNIINIDINKVYKFYNKKDINYIEGNWNFEIPVKKYASEEYKIGKDIEFDGNKITIDSIIVAPTTTLLKFSYVSFQNQKYYIDIVDDINIFSEDKKYNRKQYYPDASYSETGGGRTANSETVQFETMYFDNPKDIKIKFNSCGVSVKEYFNYRIDMDYKFPQQFEYMGNKVAIEDIVQKEDSTEVMLTEQLGESDRFYFTPGKVEVRCEGNSYTEDVWTLVNTENKETRKYKCEIKNNNRFTKIQRETEKIIPSSIFIPGYDDIVDINKSIEVKLEAN